MSYDKHEWRNGEIISAIKLNNMEEGIEDAIRTPDSVYSELSGAVPVLHVYGGGGSEAPEAEINWEKLMPSAPDDYENPPEVYRGAAILGYNSNGGSPTWYQLYPVPEYASNPKVLTITNESDSINYDWFDYPDPRNASVGNVLAITSDGPAWVEPSSLN